MSVHHKKVSDLEAKQIVDGVHVLSAVQAA